MQHVEWSDSFSLGIKAIDDQHKELIVMLNALSTAFADTGKTCPAQDLLDRLKEYAEEHFHVEEGYMQAFAYPECEAHQREHREFLESVSRFEFGCAEGSASQADVLTFLHRWLLGHIAGTDRKMGRFLEDYLR